MKSVATIKLKLPFIQELLETMRQYSYAVQEVLDWGYEMKTFDKRELHDFTYRTIRDYTELPAQLVCSSRDVACNIIKSCSFNGKKPLCKEFMTIRYDARSFSFKPNEISLCSIKGRLKIPIEVPKYFKQYLSWKVCAANVLFDRKKRLFIHIMFSKDIDAGTRSCGNGKVVGIDIGINKLAVTSDCRFFSNKEVKQKKSELRYLREKLQSKGTRSSKRHLRKIAGKEKRFMTQINHEVSKQIVGTLEAGDTIVLENLSGIRRGSKGRKLNKWLHSWSFFQFQKFLTYKAERNGVKVVKIPAKNTSKTCSKCGILHTSRCGGFLKCIHCGFTIDADLNASRNLANSYMETNGKAPVNEPIVANDDTKASNDDLRLSLATNSPQGG
jgi:putative transposase